MLSLINEIVERARANRQRIVLPEGTEERTLKAANQILTDGVADLILLGNPEEINKAAKEIGVSIEGATIIDPKTDARREQYADIMVEIRKSKGLTKEAALDLLNDPLYFAPLMIKSGDADGAYKEA